MNRDATDALEKENQLLTILAFVARTFASQMAVTECDKRALNPWAPGFDRFAQVNKELIEQGKISDKSFDDFAQAEIDVLDGLAQSLAGNNDPVAKGYASQFRRDMEIVKSLINP